MSRTRRDFIYSSLLTTGIPALFGTGLMAAETDASAVRAHGQPAAAARGEDCISEQQNVVAQSTQQRRSALLLLDFQEGIGDQPYAKTVAKQAVLALAKARNAGLLVVFSKLQFQENYSDVSPHNRFFVRYKTENKLPSGASRLIPALTPLRSEIVVNKPRFSVFSGGDLRVVLRSQGINHLVIGGVSTGGVVLTTFCEAVDDDFELTMLRDCCADPIASLNERLMSDLFPRSAEVITTDSWKAGHDG